MTPGTVVRSAAGHDKDRFYIILGGEDGFVLIADGKERKLGKPKRKNLKHVRKTNTLIDLDEVTSDRKLRALLAPFNNSGTAGPSSKGG